MKETSSIHGIELCEVNKKINISMGYIFIELFQTLSSREEIRAVMDGVVPGFSLRTEISLANYDREAVVWRVLERIQKAVSFFVCHISTPHLDGRYTIFGKVQKGMDVVDRLQIGDTIMTFQAR